MVNANTTKMAAGENVKVTETTTDGETTFTVSTASYQGGNDVQVITKQDGHKEIQVDGITTKTDDEKVFKRPNQAQVVGIKGDDKNIKTTTNDNGDVVVTMNKNIQAESVSIGDIAINHSGINAGNKVVSNVADGIAPSDAVNMKQLNQHSAKLNGRINDLDNKIGKNRKRADAGIASVVAMANIPQVLSGGKSGLCVGVGNRGGQTAIAVGYSRASENAKHIVKLSAGIDTQHKTTLGAGYMYQW